MDRSNPELGNGRIYAFRERYLLARVRIVIYTIERIIIVYIHIGAYV